MGAALVAAVSMLPVVAGASSASAVVTVGVTAVGQRLYFTADAAESVVITCSAADRLLINGVQIADPRTIGNIVCSTVGNFTLYSGGAFDPTPAGSAKIDLRGVTQAAFPQTEYVGIIAAGGADTIYGSDVNDSIWSRGGGYIAGRGGNDYIQITSKERVDAEIYGGDGDDNLWGGFGATVIYGGAGNDGISAGSDGRDRLPDTVHGGDGNDSIWLSHVPGNVAFGGPGDDLAYMSEQLFSDSTIDMGPGFDRIGGLTNSYVNYPLKISNPVGDPTTVKITSGIRMLVRNAERIDVRGYPGSLPVDVTMQKSTTINLNFIANGILRVPGGQWTVTRVDVSNKTLTAPGLRPINWLAGEAMRVVAA